MVSLYRVPGHGIFQIFGADSGLMSFCYAEIGKSTGTFKHVDHVGRVTVNKWRYFVFFASAWMSKELRVCRIWALGAVATFIKALWGFREPGGGRGCIHGRMDETVSEAAGASERGGSALNVCKFGVTFFRMCQCFRNTFFVNPAAGVNCMEKQRLVRACLGFLMSMFCLYSEIWEAASRSTWF